MLRVWLPLTKDLRNQGLDNVTVTNNGATFNSAGKLGGCYEFGPSKNIKLMEYASTFSSFNEFSLSVWFKCTAQNTGHTGSALISCGHWNQATHLLNLALGYYDTDHYTKLLITNSTGWGYGYSYNFQLNTWYHVVLTSSQEEVKAYVNGELIGNTTNAIIPTDMEQNWICIGNATYYPSFTFNGFMNDVRIYDHALSPMEVKQLSQGLILHYPLNRQGFGQENLAKNTAGVLVDKLNNALDSRTEYYAFNCGTPLNVSNGDKVTISFDLYEVVRTAGSGYLYIYNTNNKGPHQIAGVNALAGRTIAVGDIIDEHISFTTTISTRSNATQTNDFIEFYSTYGTNNFYKISNFKIEKGEIATPWCPNSSDTLATTMGLDSNIEYDTSGYCNNGTWHGTHTNTSDTPKYAVSTTATGSASTYLEGPILPTEAQTAALWIKCKKSQNAAIFNDKTSGLQIGLLNSLLYMNSKASTAGFTTTHWKDDDWNHVVVIYNGTTRKAYINGEAETQSGASNYYIHNADNCWLWNRSYNNSYPFNGSLSDLRIYATALSASDVLSLYQNCATIDPDGTIRGQIRS